jgi:hypothetical protein
MDKMNQTVLRINLLESFEYLLESLNVFCMAVRHDVGIPAWVSRTEQEIAQNIPMRIKAVRLYHALWYEEDQEGRETLTCPGIVGGTEETLAAAHACNAAKDNFKSAILALKALSKPESNALLMDLYKRNQEVAAAMKRIGAARLNLKQAYRHIPVLNKRPTKIGFTWSKQGRTIQRTTVIEARRLLERRSDTPQVRLELQRLANISEQEMLARVRSVCPHLRANILFENGQSGIERRLMQAPLPILIPLSPRERLPEFVPISPEPVGSLRLQRSDVRIEDELFLPTIRIYRYREQYRHP